jgi:hypothetical protein
MWDMYWPFINVGIDDVNATSYRNGILCASPECVCLPILLPVAEYIIFPIRTSLYSVPSVIGGRGREL